MRTAEFHTIFPDMAHRDGQEVEILHRASFSEHDLDEDGPMYAVKFPDGEVQDVFADELYEIKGIVQ